MGAGQLNEHSMKTNTAADTFKKLQTIPLDIYRIDPVSFEVEGVDRRDYPDFCDSFISYAEFYDGAGLTDDQLEQLNDEYPDIVYEAAIASVYY